MYLIALIVVFGLLGIFASQNNGTQVFTFLNYTWSLPTWVPAAIGTAATSLLLVLHMSHAGLGARWREFGHSRTIGDLRAENAYLREELASARSASTARIDGRRSWLDDVRTLPVRIRDRMST